MQNTKGKMQSLGSGLDSRECGFTRQILVCIGELTANLSPDPNCVLPTAYCLLA